MTTWAIAVGYYGKYEVSSDGRIRNIITGKILIPSVSKTGYLFVNLDRPDLPRKNAFVHRLVAEAFIPNPQNKSQVNHKDGDKTNNRTENLEWVTPAENVRHSYSVLGKKPSMEGKTGGLNRNSIPVYQYDLDGKFVKSWDGISAAARAVGCNPSQIINQIAGRIVTCHGFLWSYEEAEHIDDARVKQRKTHKHWGLS